MGRCHSEASKPCIRQSPGQSFVLNTHSKRRQKSRLLFPKTLRRMGNKIGQSYMEWACGGMASYTLLLWCPLPAPRAGPTYAGNRSMREQSVRYLLMIYSIIYSVMYSIIYSRIPKAWKFSSNPDTLVLMGKKTNSFFIPTITTWQQDCLRIPTFWNYRIDY